MMSNKPVNYDHKTYILLANSRVVQSLNSPFFLPPIGAEPGRAKRESRITCMCMLRTNQSKTTLLASMCRVMRRVKIVIWFIVVCTLIDEYASLLFSQTFFSYCFSMLSEFAKVFERKVWRVQAVICIMKRVHFQVRVGVFNSQQILPKISFVILDTVVKNKSNAV